MLEMRILGHSVPIQ